MDRVLPDRIFEMAYLFRKSKALLSAVELGVFTALTDGPLDGRMLMARLLDALVALDFLDLDQAGRRPDCASYLDPHKLIHVGGSLKLLKFVPNKDRRLEGNHGDCDLSGDAGIRGRDRRRRPVAAA